MRRDTRYGGVSGIISVFVLINLSIVFVFVFERGFTQKWRHLVDGLLVND